MGLPSWSDFIAWGLWTSFCQFVQSVIHVIIRHDAAVDTSDYTWMMDLTIKFSKLHWLRRGRCSIIHTFLNKWHGISDWLGTSWPQSYEIVQIRLISFISTFKAQPLFQCFAPWPQRTVTWGCGQNLPLWSGINLWDPHTSSVVIDGIYANRCNHTTPKCCLQLCWFILCYHGNTVIISM